MRAPTLLRRGRSILASAPNSQHIVLTPAAFGITRTWSAKVPTQGLPRAAHRVPTTAPASTADLLRSCIKKRLHTASLDCQQNVARGVRYCGAALNKYIALLSIFWRENGDHFDTKSAHESVPRKWYTFDCYIKVYIYFYKLLPFSGAYFGTAFR